MEINYIGIIIISNVVWWYILWCYISYSLFKNDMERTNSEIDSRWYISSYPNEPNIEPFTWMIFIWLTGMWCSLLFFMITIISLAIYEKIILLN